MMRIGAGGESSLEGGEGGLDFGCPEERDLGGGECCQGLNRGTEPTDKPAVKVSEAKESL